MLIGGTKLSVRDRSRAVSRRVRALTRTVRRRSGEAKADVLRLTGETGRLLRASLRETRRLVEEASRSARGRGARRKLEAARRLQALVEGCERVATQIDKRLAGEPISDRIVSLTDRDARPIRKGKLRSPTEFGYVEQLAEVTPNTQAGARGFLLPPTTAPGNPGENELLPKTVRELEALGLRPREVALDGGFQTKASEETLAPLDCERIFISGRSQPGSKRTRRRLTRYRTGIEGRVSHLKRRYGLGRSRLKGAEGERIWSGWAALAYNLDTYTLYA